MLEQINILILKYLQNRIPILLVFQNEVYTFAPNRLYAVLAIGDFHTNNKTIKTLRLWTLLTRCGHTVSCIYVYAPTLIF